MKKRYIVLLMLSILFFIASIIYKPTKKNNNISGVYFDTFVNIEFYSTVDNKTKKDIINLLENYDKNLSAFNSSGDLYKINNSNEEKITISKDTLELIESSIYYAQKYDGLFNPCLFEVTSLWKDAKTVPSSILLNEKLSHTNYSDIIINKENNTIIKKDKNIKFDLGAIAKGYISYKIKELLLERDVHNVLINLGGNILTIDGINKNKSFKIGINNPNKNNPLCVLEAKNLSVVSSGQYERFVTIDGLHYGHIINPYDGIPINNNLKQVSIISIDSTLCDVLSTVCYIKGLKEGLELINSTPNVYAIFLTNDQKVYYSDNIKELNITDYNY